MRLTIKKSGPLKGSFEVTADKSISHRALLIGSLVSGELKIDNFLFAGDCLSTLECLKKLGITIKPEGEKGLTVTGQGLWGMSRPEEVLDAGNSGTTVRLLSGILAGQRFESVITGDDSIRKRPMERIIKPLSMMGAEISSNAGGYAPLTIKGKGLHAIEYSLPVASAQVKSCILLAGLLATGETVVLEDVPTRDHTERMLEYLKADIFFSPGRTKIKGKAELQGGKLNIPGDFSTAAFFIVAALTVPGSDITLRNVGLNPTRTGLLDILKDMEAEIEVLNKRDVNNEPVGDLRVRYSEMRNIPIKAVSIPSFIDEIPVLAVAAAASKGRFEIRGASELRVKETDRILTMAEEIEKTGVQVEVFEDGMAFEGIDSPRAAAFDSHGDHRVAMSMAVAGLSAGGTSSIENAECVNISCPDFAQMLDGLRSSE